MTTAAPPRPQFKLQGVATIKHLNVRKEGPDEEKILAVDVKLAFEKVDRALCRYFDEALIPFLWRVESGEIMAARNLFLQPVQYGNLAFLGCDVKRFALSPRDGGTVDVTCSVSIYPSSDDVADLAKSVQDGVFVSVEGPRDLFDGVAA